MSIVICLHFLVFCISALKCSGYMDVDRKSSYRVLQIRTVISMCVFLILLLCFLCLHYNLLKRKKTGISLLTILKHSHFYISIMCFVYKLVCFLSTLLWLFMWIWKEKKLEFLRGKPKITGNTLLFLWKH